MFACRIIIIQPVGNCYICNMKILMVCLGNICRSPLAEGILQEKANNAGLNWIVQSAGTNGFHTGEQPHHLSQKVALMNGIDISNQVACRFTKNDFSKYDRIYAMANDVMHDMKKIAAEHFDETKVELLMNESHPGKNLDVPDPWSGPESGYHKVFELISTACDSIIAKHMANQKQPVNN